MIFDHVGIFVHDLQSGVAKLGAQHKIISKSSEIIDPVIDVKICFVTDDCGLKYELVAPLSEKSPVSGSLLQRKNILNHLGYKVKKFDNKITQLRTAGCIPIIPPTPAVAFGGRRVIFLLSPLNYIFELIED
ncbi:VOC family protein [bacterium]|nr:VOC family protein [bacterium]